MTQNQRARRAFTIISFEFSFSDDHRAPYLLHASDSHRAIAKFQKLFDEYARIENYNCMESTLPKSVVEHLACYASILRKVPVKSLVLRLYHLYTILYSSLQFSHIPFDRLGTLSELLSLAVPVRSFL